ncbi:GNAT family N-acetyltransferase [Paenibacillus massiliensis]|uniref:GNAT family N-acetyltransferase n=1 Tax=Paenibacillus massiliensis TaxID=225917 RepID=UPI000427E9D9|nr:GNAT family N-acetyltransferase [Paenibacillus massiliensis]
MIAIVNVRDHAELLEQAVQYFWTHWGAESNFNFYQDCIIQSCSTDSEVPRFYLAMEDEQIIGSYALLRSDLNSRQDLSPWMACLHVEPSHRGRGIGDLLQNHAVKEAREMGYSRLFLCTDLEGYYERTGWSHTGTGYALNDQELSIYAYQI